jgi:esterase
MELNFETWGRGPPLVVLHGLFGSLDNWHAISRNLAAHFEVLALDQRNHGRSPHCPEMDYPRLAEDVREFLERRGLGHASLLGHSMGGKAAMEFALRYPGRLDKLIVVDIAPKAYPAVHDHILEALLSLEVAACASRQQMEAALAPAIPNKRTRQFLLKSVERDPAGVFRWRMDLQGIADNYAQLSRALAPGRRCDRPALFVRGGKSEYLMPEEFDSIRSLFPHARFHTVAGAGHWVHADAPEEFLRTVLEFLEADR